MISKGKRSYKGQKKIISEVEIPNNQRDKEGSAQNDIIKTMAEQVLETSILMGLGTLNSREDTLKIIKDALESPTQEVMQHDEGI